MLSKRVHRIAILALTVVSLFGLLPPAQAAPMTRPRSLPALSVRERPLAARGRMTVDINSVDFDATYKDLTGMAVHVYFEAGDLKGVPLRVALFFFNENDEFLAAAEGTPTDFVTEEGALTIQLVLKPRYAESEWKDIPVFVPYAFLPAVQEPVNAYVIAVAGIDGQKFTRYGERKYFTINPASGS